MTHSYKKHFFHLIWSTRERKNFITSSLEPHLYAYISGVIKNYKGSLLEVGGMSDHIHLLIELSHLDKFSQLVRDIKASSSSYIHKNFIHQKEFAWQQGYGSFSVSYSGLEGVGEYIRNQKAHHAHMSFEEEYLKFLKLCQIQYDERFVLG